MTNFAVCLQRIKTIKPSTSTQQLLRGRIAKVNQQMVTMVGTLMSNVLACDWQGKVDFYHNQQCRFRGLKVLLQSHVSPELLEMVQDEMDFKVLECVCVNH